MNRPADDPLLTSDPPGFSTTEAQQIAKLRFGIEGQASPLWSERDQNFRLQTAGKNQFVLKIANAQEDPQVIDFQQQALQHIAATDPGIPVPRILPDLEGGHYSLARDTQGREHMVRLISWLEGDQVQETEASDALLQDMGRLLARLGVALRDFDHPASHHELLWDLKHAARLATLLEYIRDAQLRSLVAAAVDRFKTHVTPALKSLRSQVIHADLNRGNVLVSKEAPMHVTGIIDFGDMVFTPLVMDLAIAAAYHLAEDGDPLARVMVFIKAYHQVVPLQREEAEILADLLLARLCTSITLQNWRASLYPENSEYLLVHGAHTRSRLRHAMSFPREALQQRILSGLGFTGPA
ncbi:MAG: phosphotransferase [Xanthomonadales bacterium]|nr:phosphotransferase [Xanthomonadales bacterium]